MVNVVAAKIQSQLDAVGEPQREKCDSAETEKEKVRVQTPKCLISSRSTMATTAATALAIA